MEIILPEINKLVNEIQHMREELAELKNTVSPTQEWFDLKQACEMKGINYNTATSKLSYQPNGGKPDGIICGRKRWRRETVLQWCLLTDEDIQL